MIARPQPAALALAKQLDAAIANDTDDDDRLTRIGELCGGLSTYGFAQDLKDRLADIEESMLEDASASEYSPGRGGNDPDHYVSGRLEDVICNALDEFCRGYIRDAQALMAEPARVLQVAA